MEEKELEQERLYLIYVELPNILHRIMQLCFAESMSLEVATTYEKEIRKITDSEIYASLEKFKSIIR